LQARARCAASVRRRFPSKPGERGYIPSLNRFWSVEKLAAE